MQQPHSPIERKVANRSLVLVHDQPQPCPYLPGLEARMPLHWPTRTVTPPELDEYLHLGYRRSGLFLYRAQCGACNACHPTRVIVDQFDWSRSLKRVLKRGDEFFDVRQSTPVTEPRRVALLNLHRTTRELSLNQDSLDHTDYHSFLVETCCESIELSYWHQDQLIAVAIVDLGANSLSAVYCYFDPSYSRFSPGTYSILKQIELAERTGRQFVYLGMFVAANNHLNYKSRFVPQERLVEGCWNLAPSA